MMKSFAAFTIVLGVLILPGSDFAQAFLAKRDAEHVCRRAYGDGFVMVTTKTGDLVCRKAS